MWRRCKSWKWWKNTKIVKFEKNGKSGKKSLFWCFFGKIWNFHFRPKRTPKKVQKVPKGGVKKVSKKWPPCQCFLPYFEKSGFSKKVRFLPKFYVSTFFDPLNPKRRENVSKKRKSPKTQKKASRFLAPLPTFDKKKCVFFKISRGPFFGVAKKWNLP